ncbi:TRAP transporter substrate-binding protein [Desulfitibacter alkalitolerans]|uniref:TRAP transporter substrate-binding protein n=1 Tax=Desulfitibacter alkalitolerans TaxID=264641 RepID=UPI000481D9D0|nr:TRAP transporter substrate-binding protein [Desulfitibacter alkalitolerans]
MRNHKLLICVVLLVSMLVFVGCSGNKETAPSGGETEKPKPVVLKLGHIVSDEDIWHKAAQRFAELVDEKTNGTVKIELYPNSTLGNDRDMAEGMQMGSVDFALIAGVIGNFEPSFQILELPYLIEDEEHLRKVIYGPIGEQLAANLLESSNIRALTYWERGPRQLTTNKPVNSVADVQGLKLRVAEIPPWVAAWRAIGANPTPMAWGEVYSALEQGVVDAQENPIPYIHANHVYEVQSHIAMTSHKFEYVTLSMSNRTYEKLTPEQQQAIYEAARESAEYQNQLVAELTDKLLDDMVNNKGITVTYPDVSEFADRAKTVHLEFAERYGMDLYEAILEAAK